MRSGYFIQTGMGGVDSKEEAFKFIREILPFSVILFRSDFQGAEDLSKLVKEIRNIYVKEKGTNPPVIAIDQEGGNVVRIPWMDYSPSNYFLGMVNNEKLSYFAASLMGKQLKSFGIEWNLAPVLDVLYGVNPVLLERSYGFDVSSIEKHGISMIKGLMDSGVASTAKHFPGHGGVMEDSHEELPIDKRRMEIVMNDAKPFKSAIECGVSSIMLSHIIYNAIDKEFPASISPKVQLLLRKEMGYNGVILTDSINMKALSSNFDLEQIVKNSIGSGVDIIETNSLISASSINDIISESNYSNMQTKADRLARLIPEIKIKYNPPVEVLNAFSTIHNNVVRWKDLDPNRHFFLVFLDQKPESQVNDAKNTGKGVLERLRSMNLNFDLLDFENIGENIEGDQFIFIGRNEHFKDRFSKINRMNDKNSCMFISTSIPQDTGILSEKMGYITAGSSKTENILGAIYRTFHFF